MSVRTKRTMMRTSLPVQRSISNAICFFYDSAGLFQNITLLGHQNIQRNTYHIVLSLLIVTIVLDKQRHISGDTKLLGKLSEVNMIAMGSVLLWTLYDKIQNKFRKFYNHQENHVKGLQKSLETIVVSECMSFIEDSLRSSDEVGPFIKLSLTREFYCHSLENLKAPVVSVNVTRLKKNLLKLIPN